MILKCQNIHHHELFLFVNIIFLLIDVIIRMHSILTSCYVPYPTCFVLNCHSLLALLKGLDVHI
jgi:hypothetical protein